MNRLVSKYWKISVSLLFGVLVLLFWWLAYPVMTAYQEQYQLFLMDSDYICQLLSVPDGLARCVGEYLVQFYINHALGALILAVMFVLFQRLCWLLMSHQQVSDVHYALSFLPVMLLWLMLGDESVLLTFVVAVLMALAAMWIFELTSVRWRVCYIALMVPALYWLAGSVVLMLAVYVMLRMLQQNQSKLWAVTCGVVCVAYAVACIVVSSWWLPYPLERLFWGVDYYRFVETHFWLMPILMTVSVVLPVAMKWLPAPSGRRLRLLTAVGEAILLAALFLLLRPSFFDARKYEVMVYDYLVRCNNWTAIIAKAESKNPDLPMSVCATNLALAMKGQLGDRAFDFFQNGTQGLLPEFTRNFSTLLLTGEAYWQLGMINTAQRYAFEAMEAIPNYAKSCRAIKRLAETNLVNGQYAVARKYLLMLEKTVAYSKWAQRTMTLLGDEKAINAHSVYGKMRQMRLKEDFIFSDRELDKMIGQLLMHYQRNGVALQYLLLCPLLERDINKFMHYMIYVDRLKIGYRPRMCQEAIVFAYAQRNQQPPQGYVDPMVMRRFGDFFRTYSNGGIHALGMDYFKQTTWYYLMK